ncbi:MAG: 30S ribosomal protein S20 [Alphaproteobacteria bacterium]|nr:30S ribosomal protein S20 [Alphaproteobacteria bacterium]MBN2779510.1 30S ribosomal protein S20 [Alphaproteobacteria bacterium]
MANHKSAKKRIRRNESARQVNQSRLSRIRTFIKKVESLIGLGKKDEAKTAFVKAESEMARGVSKGVLKKNTVARKTSRLSKKVKEMK